MGDLQKEIREPLNAIVQPVQSPDIFDQPFELVVVTRVSAHVLFIHGPPAERIPRLFPVVEALW
jgi:hypothetical protein